MFKLDCQFFDSQLVKGTKYFAITVFPCCSLLIICRQSLFGFGDSGIHFYYNICFEKKGIVYQFLLKKYRIIFLFV